MVTENIKVNGHCNRKASMSDWKTELSIAIFPLVVHRWFQWWILSDQLNLLELNYVKLKYLFFSNVRQVPLVLYIFVWKIWSIHQSYWKGCLLPKSTTFLKFYFKRKTGENTLLFLTFWSVTIKSSWQTQLYIENE